MSSCARLFAADDVRWLLSLGAPRPEPPVPTPGLLYRHKPERADCGCPTLAEGLRELMRAEH
jgi:hypothetical protein